LRLFEVLPGAGAGQALAGEDFCLGHAAKVTEIRKICNGGARICLISQNGAWIFEPRARIRRRI
jgi:hypothetical protein